MGGNKTALQMDSGALTEAQNMNTYSSRDRSKLQQCNRFPFKQILDSFEVFYGFVL